MTDNTADRVDEIIRLLAKQFIDKGYDGGLNEGDVSYPEFEDYQEIAEAKTAIINLIEAERRAAIQELSNRTAIQAGEMLAHLTTEGGKKDES